MVLSNDGVDSGLGVAEVAERDSLLSVNDVVVDGVAWVDGVDWPRDTGAQTKIMAATNARDFIILASLVTSSQKRKQRFTLIKTLQGVLVLTRSR